MVEINLSAIAPIDLNEWLAGMADSSISIEELEYGLLKLLTECINPEDLAKNSWIFANPSAFKQWCIQNVPSMTENDRERLDAIRPHASSLANALNGYNELINGKQDLKDFL